MWLEHKLLLATEKNKTKKKHKKRKWSTFERIGGKVFWHHQGIAEGSIRCV